MKLFLLGPDLWSPQPVWMNIFWPHYQVMSKILSTTFLPMPPSSKATGPVGRRLANMALRARKDNNLTDLVREGLDQKGPNILITYALGAADVLSSRLLNSVWDDFDYRVLLVVDTLQPDHLPDGELSRFDLILSYCAEAAEDFTRVSNVPSILFPPHGDTLAYHSLQKYRPIDLLLVGRRDADRHAPIHRHFNSPNSNRLSLDFVTRTQTTPLPEEEFGLLMATYGRSKTAFCFEPSDNTRFRGRSPLTGRWLHAWVSGCTVIGKAPSGTGVKAQMDWPEATIELPEDNQAAIEAVEAILNDAEGLARRRKRNVLETLRRHDTRLRLRSLFKELDLPLPETLIAELSRLEKTADEISDLELDK